MVSGIMRLRVPTRWQIHTGFWVFVLILYTLFFAQGVDRFWNMFVFVALLMPVIIGASYFVNYYLVPAYLLKGRYTSFVVYFLYTLLAAVFMESFIAMGIFLLLADLDIQRISAEAISRITINNAASTKRTLKAESRGVGLRNIREQLLLLFPGRHSFEVEEGPDYFQVQLSLVV